MRPGDRLRARCRIFLDAHLPHPFAFTAIEHGRMHHGDDEQRAREWLRLKAQGVKTGVEDMQILCPHFVAAEVKAGDDVMSAAQERRQRDVEANGHTYIVVRSVVGLHDDLVRLGVQFGPLARPHAEAQDRELAVEAAAEAAARVKAKVKRAVAPAKPKAAKSKRGSSKPRGKPVTRQEVKMGLRQVLPF